MGSVQNQAWKMLREYARYCGDRLNGLSAIQLATVLWGAVVACLLLLTLLNVEDVSNWRLFSDQASHILATISVWEDWDLKYTLADLARFRDVMPSETGPRGAFLKTGADGDIYYAKPFLYAFWAAPFVGLLGLKGFIVANAVAFFVIGWVALRALHARLDWLTVTIALAALMIFSPYPAWLPVAHPDLLIAAGLALGAYLVLGKGGDTSRRVAGGVVLGLVLYEKITFAPLVAAVFAAASAEMRPRDLGVVLASAAVAWLGPSLIHFMQDGTWVAYMGDRFYVSANASGEFPLEENWQPPSRPVSSGEAFDLVAVVKTLAANLTIIPEKTVDLILGRQTGLLLYFSIVLLMLVLWGMSPGRRGAILLGGLAGYFLLNALVFPTNGYGGAGTYGPRYTMQAISLLPLILLPEGRLPSGASSLNSKWITGAALVSLLFSAVAHGHVLVNGRSTVAEPRAFLQSRVAGLFPWEHSILPTVHQVMPEGFGQTNTDDTYLFNTCDLKQPSSTYHLGDDGKCEFVLYRMAGHKKPSRLQVAATDDGTVKFGAQNTRYSEAQVVANRTKTITIPWSKANSATDILRGEVQWQEVVMSFKRDNAMERVARNPPALTSVRLAAPTSKPQFSKYGVTLKPSEFEQQGIDMLFDWGQIESWGIWTTGSYAALYVPKMTGERQVGAQLDFRVYAPPERAALKVDVYLNGDYYDRWKLRQSDGWITKHLERPVAEQLSGGDLAIGMHVHDPISPEELGLSTDPRPLGIGLRSLKIYRLSERLK